MNRLLLTLFFTTILFVCNTVSSFSQTDSTNLKLKAARILSNRFPSTRTINLEYEYITPLDFKTKTHDNKAVEQGSFKNQNRVKLDLNLPFLRLKKWVFTGSLRYRYNYFDVEDITDSYSNTAYKSRTIEGNTYNVGLNSTYISRLFDKPTIFNISVTGDFSQNGFERFTGIAVGTMVLKRNSKMALSVGMFAIIDPMVHYPIMPIVAIEYKLPKSWVVSVAMPQYAYIRKNFSNNNRLSIGTHITSDSYYMQLGDPKESYRYNKAEIKTGIVYEHYLHDKIILTARGGMVNALEGTLNKRNNSYNKYIVKSNQDAGIYFNIGISYNIW